MTKINEKEKIAEVLCDSGEMHISDNAETVKEVLDAGGAALDGACLTNVVVVKTKSGKYLVGEFGFEFREVTKKEAERVTKDFGLDDDDEAEE